MLQQAMRGAGYKAWSVGSHSGPQGEWNESDLNVTNFRIPAVTHPRANNNTLRNRPAASIQFLDLAHHIKEHPSGHDALDLTRCVRYALQHPQETWIFPDDFERLVNQLGGPAQVTSYHCDAQVFRRADSTVVGSTIAGSVPITKKRKSSAMARTRAIGNTDSGATTPRKRATLDPDDLSTPPTSAVRRSGRLRTKPSDNAYKDDSDVDESEGKVNTPRSAKKRNANDDIAAPRRFKKRKVTNDLANDGDFQADTTSSDDTLPDHITDEDYIPALTKDHADTTSRKSRTAAKKARESIKQSAVQETSKPKIPEIPIDPALMEAARQFATRKPALLKPPAASRDAIRVDSMNVHLFAAEGAKDVWASALSSSRYNGPRVSPPFRELYRLSDPSPFDDGDWAENVRWAKEQYKFFGSKTWTEYDYHLDLITEHRRDTMWVSETAIACNVRR
jgi:hypothetical protein